MKLPGAGQFVRPSLSPDSKWVYYTNSSTGRREVYRMPFSGGAQTQFTHEGGTDALSSSDGSIVFFYRDGEVRRIAASGGQETTVTRDVGRGRWTVAGDKVYVVRDRGERSVVVEMARDGSNEKVVYEVPFRLVASGTVSTIAVSSRTGDIFLQQEVRTESDLMIVEGFR